MRFITKKHRFNGYKKSSFLTVLLCITFTFNAQTVHIVDNNQGAGAQYTGVQDAIDAATSGDIIYIQPSPNNYGNLNISKTLTIYGIGYNPELNNGQHAVIENIYFNGNASGTQISGLQINGINLTSGSLTNHNVIITNNRINGTITGNNNTSNANNAIISGNYFIGGASHINVYSSQNWIISNNIIEHSVTYNNWTLFKRFNASTIFNNNIIKTIQNGDSNGSITIFENCTGTQINNNIFLFTGTDIANFNNGANSGLNFHNNLTYSYNSTLDALSGTNNIDNSDPMFTAFNPGLNLHASFNNYTIQTGSPAENAGTDGQDLGVENGGFPFNTNGYPTALPYLTDFVIYNNIISPGQPLNINIKANANIQN